MYRNLKGLRFGVLQSCAVALFTAALLPAGVARAQANVSPEVQALYAKAQQAAAANNEPAAIANYQRIVKLAPDLAPAYNNLGRLLYNQGRFAEAADTLRRGLAINADMAPAQVILGASLLQLGKPADALAPLQAGVAALPDDRFARISLARTEIALDRPADALGQLDAILQTDPKDQESWYLLGKLHLQLSEEAFTHMQSLGENTPLALQLKGEIAESMNNTAGAIAAYKQALGTTPGDTGALQHLADVYYKTGDYEQARQQYTKLLARQPGNCTARWHLGRSMIELADRADAALPELNTALKECPDLAEAHADRARLLLRTGHPQDALTDLDIAVKIAPEEPQVQRLYAEAYRALGDTARAQQANQRFVELDRAQHEREEKRAAAVVDANRQ